MIRIETEIEQRALEIDGVEYQVAPRTIELCEKLLEANKKCIGKPAYRLKLAEIEILLGRAAYKGLFPNGDKENVDRIDAIYRAVSQAFTANEEALNNADIERRADALRATLAPVAELMKTIRATNAPARLPAPDGVKEIRRPQT